MKENYVEDIEKLNHARSMMNIVNGLKDTSYIFEQNNISIEDLYYILKFYGMQINNRTRLHIIDKLLYKKLLGSDIYNNLKELDINDDNRLLIIPHQIRFNSLIIYGFKPILLSLDELNIYPETNSIYLSNWDHVNAIKRVLSLKKNQIENLLIDSDLMDSYEECYGRYDCDQNIIEVPHGIEYSELSKTLKNKKYHF